MLTARTLVSLFLICALHPLPSQAQIGGCTPDFGNAIAFDIDPRLFDQLGVPGWTDGRRSHFEQIYDRAVTALRNANAQSVAQMRRCGKLLFLQPFPSKHTQFTKTG